MNATQRQEWRRFGLNCALATAVFSVVIGLSGQKSSLIDVSDHRPLARALETLQALTGTPINYEDVPYENAADLQDVSTPEQRAKYPGYHLLVPRKGQVKATVAVNPKGSLAETIAGVSALLASYRSAGMPGDFRAEQANGMIYVVPTKVLTRAGIVQDVQPRMDALVTFPSAQMRAIDCVQAITRAVSEATGAKVAVGAFPPFPAAQSVPCGANRESARNLLAAVLSKWSNRPATYDLLFDPVSGYMLNLRLVAQVGAPSSAPPPAPGSTTSPFFKRQ